MNNKCPICKSIINCNEINLNEMQKEFSISLPIVKTIFNYIESDYSLIYDWYSLMSVSISISDKNIEIKLYNLISILENKIVKNFIYFSGYNYYDIDIINVLFDIICYLYINDK